MPIVYESFDENDEYKCHGEDVEDRERLEKEIQEAEVVSGISSDFEDDLKSIEISSETLRNSFLDEYKDWIKTTQTLLLSIVVTSVSGNELFDELCLRIDINQKYASILPQWKDLAELLSVDSLKSLWIETCVRPKEGLTRAMLEIYMRDNGTLGEVLSGLLKLECFSILESIKEKMRNFLRDPRDSSTQNSKYFSLLGTLLSSFPIEKDPCFALQSFRHGLKVYAVQSSSSCSSVPLLKNENYTSSLHGNLERIKSDWEEKDSICRILLVFASDGLSFSEEIRILIQGFEYEGVRAEVFRLNEISLWYEVLSNPEACCMKWANEADYIMPILTPQLLKDFYGGYSEESLTPTSPVLNRYLYTLLRSRYTEEGCKNTMVRPIIPMVYLKTIGQSSLVRRDPLLRLIWIPQKTERLHGRLKCMLSEFKKKKLKS